MIELRSAKPADIKVEFVDDVPRIQTKIYLRRHSFDQGRADTSKRRKKRSSKKRSGNSS